MERRARVTIKDIARFAGVSPTTVSDIVNGKGRVDPSTRDRVLGIITELGWTPLRSAQALRTGNRGIIALCLPRRPDSESSWGRRSDYDMRLTIATVTAAIASGKQLLMAPAPRTDADVFRLEVDGVILVDPERGDLARLALGRTGMPVVTIERELSSDDPWWVGIDNVGAMRKLLEYLHDRGARTVAFLTSTSDWAWFTDTRAAYTQWTEATRSRSMIAFIDRADPEASAAHAVSLLLDAPHPPDAIVTDVYGAALGVVRGLEARGLSSPSDVLVGSAVDGHALESAHPSITAVDLQPSDVAVAAVQLLERRISGAPSTGPMIVGDGELRVRDTTSLDREMTLRSSFPPIPPVAP